MVVGSLIKFYSFFLRKAPQFIIFEVRRLATQVDTYPSEVEQHHSKFVFGPLS